MNLICIINESPNKVSEIQETIYSNALSLCHKSLEKEEDISVSSFVEYLLNE